MAVTRKKFLRAVGELDLGAEAGRPEPF